MSCITQGNYDYQFVSTENYHLHDTYVLPAAANYLPDSNMKYHVEDSPQTFPIRAVIVHFVAKTSLLTIRETFVITAE